MNYATIKYCDIANGVGVRTSLFVSGCRLHCKNCFNEEAWSFSAGKPFTQETEEEILSSLAAPYVDGLSVLGGGARERRGPGALPRARTDYLSREEHLDVHRAHLGRAHGQRRPRLA